MINTRALNSKDLETLDSDILQIKKRLNFTAKYFAGYTVLVLIGSAWAYIKIDPKDFIPWVITTIGFFAAGFWGFIELYLRGNKALKQIDWVKKENKVVSISVTSNEYIEICEQEDEGNYFLFQLSDNKIVYVGGQSFYVSDTFPNNNFEIAIATGQKNKVVLLNKYEFGKKIEPKIKLTKTQRIKLSDRQIDQINKQDPIIREIAAFLTGSITEIEIVNYE